MMGKGKGKGKGKKTKLCIHYEALPTHTPPPAPRRALAPRQRAIG
jgi:hypothetical protein